MNELARYHAFDVTTCNDAIGHRTCPNQCTDSDLFMSDSIDADPCSFIARSIQFITNGIKNGADIVNRDDIKENGIKDIIEESTWNGNFGFANE
eukprot:413798_1